MTLLEMAQLVVDKLNKPDAASLNLAKRFIKRRWQLVYDSALWREHVAVFAGENRWDSSAQNASGQFALTPKIERVISIRFDPGTMLSLQEPWEQLNMLPTSFENTGDPVSFSRMRPVAYPFFGYDPGDGIQIKFRSTSAADTGNVYIKGSKESDLSFPWKETVPLLGASQVQTNGRFDITSSITCDDHVGSIEFGNLNHFDPVGTIRPGENTSDLYPRVKINPAPTEVIQLLVLGKLRIPPLIDDTDAPQLQGVEDCLIAHAQADMLEKFRQYAKSELKRNEAMAQYDKLVGLEVDQSAHSIALQPIQYDSSYDSYNEYDKTFLS